MAPAALGGAQAEIVFLAIATAKRLGVERADIPERGAADIHAEPDGGRDLHPAAAINGAAHLVERVDRQAECRGTAPKGRVAADRGIVRERRDAD